MPKLSLTAQKVKSAKAINGKRTEYLDTKAVGLALRVTPTGAKSWSMLYYRKSDAKRRRVTIGKYPAISLEVARAKARGILTIIANGEDPAGQKQEGKKAASFAELAGFYIERYAKKKKRTWQEDQRMIEHDLLPEIGSMKADQVTKKDIIRVVDAIADRGAGYMANRVLVLVSKVYNWAVEEDLQTFNPAYGVKKRHIEESRARVLDNEEIKQFWESLHKTSATLPVRTILRLTLLTGQRVGEITGAEKSELDLKSKTWHLPKERTKNKKPHSIPLAPMALELFREAIEASNSRFVFPSPLSSLDKPIVRSAASRTLSRNKDIIQITDFRVHDLRRTVATQMTKLKIDRLHVGKVLNHASIDRESITGMVYDRNSYDEEKRIALERWESHLQALLTDTENKIVSILKAG